MSRHVVLALVLFVALLLSAALTALAASGHFPPEHRAASLRSGVGRAILFGACAVSALSLAVGVAVAWLVVPWPAAVIGAGAAALAAPLLLRPLPDRSEEHTSELQSQSNLVCRLLLEKKKKPKTQNHFTSKFTCSPFLYTSHT